MFKFTRVVLMCTGLMLIGGCTFLDSVFLNSEMKAALKETEEAKAETKKAKELLSAAVTEEEKTEAKASLLAAADRMEAAEVGLNKALESNTPSTAESIAALAANFGLPWLLTAVGATAATYKHVRAKKGDRAIGVLLEGVEEMAETEPGKKIKKKLSGKFEKKGLTPYIDGGLRVLGLLKKSA